MLSPAPKFPTPYKGALPTKVCEVLIASSLPAILQARQARRILRKQYKVAALAAEAEAKRRGLGELHSDVRNIWTADHDKYR